MGKMKTYESVLSVCLYVCVYMCVCVCVCVCVLKHAPHPLRRDRGIAVCILSLDARRGWVVSTMPQPLSTQERDPVPILQEAGWALGPLWMGLENPTPTEVQDPDC